MKKTVLVIEPETETQDLLRSLLGKVGLEVVVTGVASEGIDLARNRVPDFVLMNLYPNAPIVDEAGFALLRRLCEELHLPVIVTGRVVNLEAVRTLMQLGARDYVPYPISHETLFPSIQRLLEVQELREEVERLRREVDEQYRLGGLIGRSSPMRQIFRLLPQIAHSTSPVLIVGESGTGKELITRAIHHNSPRRWGPFVALNCGVFPETLVESELFGHEKGAFTGAVMMQKGIGYGVPGTMVPIGGSFMPCRPTASDGKRTG
jgi:DNA-binding NtrC family response regulator